MRKAKCLNTFAALAMITCSACSNAALAATDPVLETIRKGGEFFKEERYQDAISCLNQAIRQNPDSAKAYELRAKAYAEMGEYKKAILDYTKLINLSPATLANYNERSMLYLQLKNYPDAVLDLSKVIELSQDHLSYYTRAWAYGRMGEHEKAVEDYTRFIAVAPDDISRADGYYNRGNEYYELKQNSKAMDDFNKAAKLNSAAGLDINAISTRSMRRGNNEISLVPDYAKAYYRCAQVYSSLGRYQNAVENFSKAICLNPDLPDYYKNRAEAYDKLGQHDKAASDRNKANDLGGIPGGKKPVESTKDGGKPASADMGKVQDLDKFNQCLADLEKKTLGRTYSDDLITDRLERLETKILGKTQAGSLKHRLELILLKSEG